MKCCTTPPWYINELKSSVAGHVGFTETGTVTVWFGHDRHPRKIGLQPRFEIKYKVKVKAIICDVENKILPEVNVGEIVDDMDERSITYNGYTGCMLGEKSCGELFEKGYADKEGYMLGAILIGYDVTIV
jgi:hypothetical protein